MLQSILWFKEGGEKRKDLRIKRLLFLTPIFTFFIFLDEAGNLPAVLVKWPQAHDTESFSMVPLNETPADNRSC